MTESTTLIKPSQKTIKKHYDQIAKIIRANKSSSQEALIAQLNPVIRGWCNYNKTVVSKEIFTNLDHLTYQRLKRWAKRRHPNKGKKWLKKKYWKTVELRNWVFKSNDGAELKEHSSTPIIRHIKVRGNKSPFDGDKIYWGKRLQASTELTTREHKLLKKQKGKCTICHIEFKTGELWEIDHIIPRKHGG